MSSSFVGRIARRSSDKRSERFLADITMEEVMKTIKVAIAAGTLAVLAGGALAQSNMSTNSVQLLQQLPSEGTTVTNYYKQNVYDPSDSKIGEISDVLVGRDGHVTAFIVSAGGFLGLGEKDVAVPFSAVRATDKNGSWYLVLNTTKDALKTATGYKYDKSKTTWVLANS
jgi:sporulation protein YlmC with PRC-barrel domain